MGGRFGKYGDIKRRQRRRSSAKRGRIVERVSVLRRTKGASHLK